MNPLFHLSKRMKALKARKAAWLAHQDALRRGDTRDIHNTRETLIKATHDKLKIELGYR